MSEDRLADLYLEALDLDDDRRRALVAGLRPTEPALAEELERLLAAPEGAPSPIDGSALAAAGVEAALAAAPERVGPYRIVRELGRGGMGRVFLAEQETPDFRRTVALKLIDRPGPDEEAVRRFRAEVRILASLDHPGIVRFFDGGRSPEGIWFLSQEYVEGEDLITHASARGLDVPSRLRLVVAVAEAVEFAHARGVVHRDLKPTNVLVGRDGRPRLLDFGISKLQASPGADHPTLTHADRRPLTPAYASPEQLAGEPATPASDVYSLGVVLYELLAGRRPFASASSLGSSRPTLELGVVDSHPEAPSAARRRASTASGERRFGFVRSARARGGRIDRNLDAICLQALQRNPADRYPSASALAEDLRRHLAGRRAGARRRSGGARRDRLRSRGVLALAALAVLLLVASIVWIARPRPGAERPAPAPAGAVGFPFDPLDPPPIAEMERRLAEAPDDVAAGAALVLGLERDQRESEARIVIGRLRQVPGKELDPLIDYAEGRLASRRGEDQRAVVLYGRARDHALAQGRGELLGTIRLWLASALSRLGQRDAAQEELELARAECERAGDHKALYHVLTELAIQDFQRGEMDRGEASLESALGAARRGGLEPLAALSNLAEAKLVRGRPDLAEPLAREALELGARTPSPVREADELNRLSRIVRDLGHAEEAESLLEQALARLRTAGHPLAHVLYARALADLEGGRLDRLEALAQELEAAGQAALRRRPLGLAHSVRARLAAVRGDLPLLRQHFAEARRLLLAEGDGDLAAFSDLAWVEAEVGAGAPQAARRILDEGLGAFDAATATLAGSLAEALRARLDAEAGLPDAARQRLARLGEDGARAPSVSRRLAFLRARARLAAAEGRPEAARDDLGAALEAARRARRKLDELELRLDLAALAGAPETKEQLASEVEREATALGLSRLAEKARTVAPQREPSRSTVSSE